MWKRQRSDDLRHDAWSTESDGVIWSPTGTKGGESCMHIQQLVELPTIRKKIMSSGLDKLCGKCTQDAFASSASVEKQGGGTFVNDALWLCLTCGTHLCSSQLPDNLHLLQHFMLSDGHELAMNTSTFAVYCFRCNENCDPNAIPELYEIVQLLTQAASKQRDSTGSSDANNQDEQLLVITDSVRKPAPMTSVASFDVPDAAKLGGNIQPDEIRCGAGVGSWIAATDGDAVFAIDSQGEFHLVDVRDPLAIAASDKPNTVDPKSGVRGLLNLSNTCFFNAALQCLARTPYLLTILSQSAVEVEKVHIPGGTLQLPDGTEVRLPPIDGVLKGRCGLTGTLAVVLAELISGASSVFMPNRLLNEVTEKWPQFAGSDQHDAHELLRNLIESVRNDDLRRYQKLILHSLKLDKRTSQLMTDENQKAKVRFYDDQISQWVFRPEQVFRGSLLSTLTCQDCGHTSSRHENFLDISLPVCVENPPPSAEDWDSPGEYVYLAPTPAVPLAFADTTAVAAKARIKKERVREKKARRMAKHQKNRINLSSVGIGGAAGAFSPLLLGGDTAGDNDGHADLQHMAPLIVDDSSSDDSLELPGADVEDNDVVDGGAPTVDQNGNQAQPRSAIPEKIDDLPEILNKEPAGGSNGVCEQPDGAWLRQGTYSNAGWINKIARRSQSVEGEYSVYSCFNHFIAAELMSGNNKVCCEACTERINGKGGKSVSTNATKQFLISEPPAVLILHLKRFQVGPRGYFQKAWNPVTFPFVLDIAPFCGSKVKRASHIRPGQKKILYSLYGLVEHVGMMQSGHYVAYVKVRPPFGPDDVRWKFIPQGTKDELDRKSEQEMAKEQARRMGVHLHDSDDSPSSTHSGSEGDAVDEANGPFGNIQQQQQRKRAESGDQKEEEEGAVGYTPKPPEAAPEVEPLPGKWYCVSDESVYPIADEDVLKVQAYLLFYERIF